MTKLAKEKRDKIGRVVVLTVLVISALWVGVTQPLAAARKTKSASALRLDQTLHTLRRNVAMAGKLKVDLVEAQQRLEIREAKLPEGDVYRWIIRTFNNLQSSKVDFAALESPRSIESRILPKVPHRTAIFSLAGTARYGDFGTFLANLENTFPLMRLQRLELEPTHYDPTEKEQETINFKLEILTLVKASPDEQ